MTLSTSRALIKLSCPLCVPTFIILPLARLRINANNSTRKSIDPRFADFSGKLDDKIFSKNYSFLEDYRSDEIAALSKAMKKEKNSSKREQIKTELDK